MNNVRRTAVGAALAVLTLVLLASCAGAAFTWKPSPETSALLAGPRPAYPAARFAVISDPHLYDAVTLGAGGEAFDGGAGEGPQAGRRERGDRRARPCAW